MPHFIPLQYCEKLTQSLVELAKFRLILGTWKSNHSLFFLTISFSIFFQLDYFSAFSIVVYSLLAFFLRILGSWRSSKGIKWSNFAAILGKKHALKTYDQLILYTSCFWGSTGSNISPQFTMASIIVEVKISWKKFQQQNFPEIRNLKTASIGSSITLTINILLFLSLQHVVPCL